MTKLRLKFLLTLLFLGCLTAAAQEETGPTEIGQPEQTEQEPAAPERGRFGVSYGGTYPAPIISLSLEVELGAGFRVEAVAAPFPFIAAYGVKAKYDVWREPAVRVYGFGLAMLITSFEYDEHGKLFQLEPSYGGGLGVETALPSGSSDPENAPEVWGSLELGFVNNGPSSDSAAFLFGTGITFYF